MKKLLSIGLTALMMLLAIPGMLRADEDNKVATPEITPGSGSVVHNTLFYITCNTPGATIYCQRGDNAWAVFKADNYNNAINADVVRACAVKEGMVNSDTVTVNYQRKVAVPNFVPRTGIAVGGKVTINRQTASSKVWYKVGEEGEWKVGTSGFGGSSATVILTEDSRVYACAVSTAAGVANSDTIYADFVCQVASPVFSQKVVAIPNTNITLTSASAGAEIYFAKDAETTFTKYEADANQITITDTCTYRAYAVISSTDESGNVTSLYSDTVSTSYRLIHFTPEVGEVENNTKVDIAITGWPGETYEIKFKLYANRAEVNDDMSSMATATTYGTGLLQGKPTIKTGSTFLRCQITVGEALTTDIFAEYSIKSSTPVVPDTVKMPTFSVAAGEVEKDTKVTISCATEGAKIYYTVDGSVPTATSTEYTAEINIDKAMTIKAIAVKEGMTNSQVAEAAYTIKEPAPAITITFDPESGSTVAENTSVTVTCSDETKELKFQMCKDADEMTMTKMMFSTMAAYAEIYSEINKPVIKTDETAVLVAYQEKGEWVFAEAIYTIQGDDPVVVPDTVKAPTFSVAAGEVAKDTKVALACATEGAKIYYTVDGSAPTAESTEYTAEINIDKAMTIKAIAIKEGMVNSPVAEAAYTVKGDTPVVPDTVKAPTFSVAAGEVAKDTKVALACATEGAKIYYTVDGSAPTAESTEYTAEINIDKAMTIKAIAIKEGMVNSSVAEAAYTIKETPVVPDTVKAPTFSVAAGEVAKDTKVALACATEGAKIYYTVDGSAPTAESTEYTAEINIDKAMTIKAIAIKEGMVNSPVAEAAYTVKTVANEAAELAGVRVYPNPNDGEFKVNVPVKVLAEVFASNGVVVERIQMNAGVNALRLENSGIYFIRFTASNGQVAIKKVVIR